MSPTNREITLARLFARHDLEIGGLISDYVPCASDKTPYFQAARARFSTSTRRAPTPAATSTRTSPRPRPPASTPSSFPMASRTTRA